VSVAELSIGTTCISLATLKPLFGRYLSRNEHGFYNHNTCNTTNSRSERPTFINGLSRIASPKSARSHRPRASVIRRSRTYSLSDVSLRTGSNNESSGGNDWKECLNEIPKGLSDWASPFDDVRSPT